MTAQRAAEIIKQAQAAARFGPWVDQLRTVMTKEERGQVMRVWDEMPGHTCFADALLRIARGAGSHLKSSASNTPDQKE